MQPYYLWGYFCLLASHNATSGFTPLPFRGKQGEDKRLPFCKWLKYPRCLHCPELQEPNARAFLKTANKKALFYISTWTQGPLFFVKFHLHNWLVSYFFFLSLMDKCHQNWFIVRPIKHHTHILRSKGDQTWVCFLVPSFTFGQICFTRHPNCFMQMTVPSSERWSWCN